MSRIRDLLMHRIREEEEEKAAGNDGQQGDQELQPGGLQEKVKVKCF